MSLDPDFVSRVVVETLINSNLAACFDAARDTLVWTSPLGPLGLLADWLMVKRHLRNFLRLRAERLRGFLECGGTATSTQPAPTDLG